MKCTSCESDKTRVIDTNHDNRGGIRRRRQCVACGKRFTTYERPILATPLLIKKDGTREEFSRDKLYAGLRLASSKRPISAETIERIIGEVEHEISQVNAEEIESRMVGDLVIKKLKDEDDVAYLRYAIVYLQLNDIGSIKAEIDQMLSTQEEKSAA